MRPGPLAAAIVAIGAVTGLVLAQSPPPAKLIPHEDLPAPTDKTTPMIGDVGSGRNPAAFTAGDKVLPKPALDAPKDKAPGGKREPVLGKGGFAADRQTDMRPDENTGPDSTLHYVSVFNPDVLPFKRMSAFDAVHEDQSLHVARTLYSEIPVGGTTDFRTRDRFWGDVLLDLHPGVDVPLPSVAPDMRILSYEVKPRIHLTFSKDGADNFYVKSDESNASGTYRLVFLADADAGYFAAQLPKLRLKVGDVVRAAPPEIRPIIPSRVLVDAHRTLRNLGIDDPDLDLGSTFNKLVGYFRGFSAKPLEHPSGDIYRDLCDTKAGVCRHRSFAFMITANALGIPTRYVENEAHAFVEVWFPERSWQRIDLGGAALRMEVTGADSKTLHRPRSEDPFTKPHEYTQSYTNLEGEISGITEQQKKDKQKSLDQSPASGALGSGPGSGAGSGGGPDRINPNPNLPAVTMHPEKGSPKLSVTIADPHAYRGDIIHVEGNVRVGDRGIGDHRVDVFLAPIGDHEHSIAIGNAVTQADGSFRVDLAVPTFLNLATYEILLSSGEDAYYNAALSD
ncbi:MAG: transglutaminase domain protein [Myxococcales bacterium]|nr:transglutaminase domain protein [Myxococcales bacterium]